MKRFWLAPAAAAVVFTWLVLHDSLTASEKLAGKRISFGMSTAAAGHFPAKWIHGSESAMDNTDPPVQVHWYNEHTVILRQNKAYEVQAPFMFLYFGNDRALLLDQGSVANPRLFPIREVVDEVVAQWCKRQGREDIHLVVGNTHLHGDHYSGWNQFVDRPNTTMVGLTHEERMAFFKITDFPVQRVQFDLGGRSLVIWGSPGHEASEIAVYDPWTRLLCTGDMFYPGRCYVRDWPKWFASIERLVKFTEEFPVSHLVNCHIEISAQGVDYPTFTSYQPDEPPMHMTVETLRRTYAVAKTVTKVGIHPVDGKVFIYNQMAFAETQEKNEYAY
jgi:glyoxylase-like metal-dependent hydrolase (beta-lactamase superfamily II)